MNIQEIVTDIKSKYPNINNVFFVGCGASQSDLYPSKYFLAKNAKRLRTEVITANEFNYDPPVTAGPEASLLRVLLVATRLKQLPLQKRLEHLALLLSV